MEKYKSVSYKAGSVIYYKGDVADKLYLISSGKIRILTRDQVRLHSVAVLDEKSFLGEIELFHLQKRLCYAVAMTDVTLYEIPRDDLMEVLTSCTPWVSNMLKSLGLRYTNSFNLILENGIFSSEGENFVDEREQTRLMRIISNRDDIDLTIV